MRIGLVTDLHYCSLEVLLGRRKPQLALRRLREALDRFVRADARLIVCLGDLINDEGDPQRNAENLDAIARVFKEPGLPCVCLMGNHDGEAFTPETFERITGWSAAPGTWAREDLRLHFLNANYHWDGSAYRPGHVDWRE
nr:metallophosphoesterase [Clostridia bacterium]